MIQSQLKYKDSDGDEVHANLTVLPATSVVLLHFFRPKDQKEENHGGFAETMPTQAARELAHHILKMTE